MANEVGRIYLEDAGGYLGQVSYGVHPAFRAPEIRWEGRPFHQVRQLEDGRWVYRTTTERAGTGTLDTLTGFVGAGDVSGGWVAPSDYVTAPNPAAVAFQAFTTALEQLRTHPEHADVVARVDGTPAEVAVDEADARPDA